MEGKKPRNNTINERIDILNKLFILEQSKDNPNHSNLKKILDNIHELKRMRK